MFKATFAALAVLGTAGLLLAPTIATSQEGQRVVREAPRLTGPQPFMENPVPPPIARDVADDRRVVRNFPDQPPVIPHNVRDYQVDLNTNHCLNCHSRTYTAVTGAPMISITHYQDREGNTLGGVAPRRYFCMTCHVPQTDVAPLVPNTFQDIDSLLRNGQAGGGR